MNASNALEILVLDDEDFMLRILSLMLDQLGFKGVKTANCGDAALRLVDLPSPPHLVLLDLNMPGMDGVEFIRSLVARKYAGSLILVSGETERVVEAVAKLARAHGMHVLGHVQKPVTRQALEALLAAWELPVFTSRASGSRPAYDAGTLAAAIASGELVNYYQPKVKMRTGEFVGAEVLVRWRHPVDGLVYPDQFIPIAEQYGLMRELTSAVLREALCQVRAWYEQGLHVKPAINISMDNLNVLQFPDDVARLAGETGVAISEIQLEITESQLMPNLLSVLDILSRLRLKRVSLAIDDFGTGHSSLAQLSDMPFDQLKIDKRFVHGAHADQTASTIFIASHTMGNQLGMEVVAEGVEDRADWDWLQNMHCDVAQGYFIARPMPAQALPAWLSEWGQRIQAEKLVTG